MMIASTPELKLNGVDWVHWENVEFSTYRYWFCTEELEVLIPNLNKDNSLTIELHDEKVENSIEISLTILRLDHILVNGQHFQVFSSLYDTLKEINLQSGTYYLKVIN